MRKLLSPQRVKKKVKVKVAQLCLTLRPHGLYSPWNSPGQNAGVGSRSLLQGLMTGHSRVSTGQGQGERERQALETSSWLQSKGRPVRDSHSQVRRADGCLDQSGSCGDGGHWEDFVYALSL